MASDFAELLPHHQLAQPVTPGCPRAQGQPPPPLPREWQRPLPPFVPPGSLGGPRQGGGLGSSIRAKSARGDALRALTYSTQTSKKIGETSVSGATTPLWTTVRQGGARRSRSVSSLE